MFLYLGFECLIIDVKVEALAVILMVYVPVRHEFFVNCPVVTHLYLSDQSNLTSILPTAIGVSGSQLAHLDVAPWMRSMNFRESRKFIDLIRDTSSQQCYASEGMGTQGQIGPRRDILFASAKIPSIMISDGLTRVTTTNLGEKVQNPWREGGRTREYPRQADAGVKGRRCKWAFRLILVVFIVSSMFLEASVASVLITPLELRWSYKDRRTQMLAVEV